MSLGWVCLSEVSEGRDNNLNLIRICAALAVLVSHAWPLSLGLGTVQPLQAATGFALGSFGLFTFFAISGFLIARSWDRRPSLAAWLAARALRLFPALAVVLVLTAFALGPLVTTLPLDGYLGDPTTWSYVPRNLALAPRQAGLPGVFKSLPYRSETNGSLWTLYYEVICYGGVLVMGALGAFRAWTPLIVVGCLYAALNVAVIVLPAEAFPFNLRPLLSLGLPFACGVGFYVARRWLPLTPLALVVLIAAAVALFGTPLYQPALVLALAYGVFLLAYLPKGFVLNYNRLGDYSYGVYVYGWPVQQTVVQVAGPMGPLENVLLSAPVVVALAWLSWTFVEKPSLDLVRHFRDEPSGARRERLGQ